MKSRSLRERQKRLEKKIVSFLDPSLTKRFKFYKNNLWYFLFLYKRQEDERNAWL